MHSFLGIEIHATISTVKTITLFKFVILGVSSVKGLQKGKQYEILRPRLADFPLSMPDNPIFQSFDANCTIFRVYIAVNEAVNSCSLRWTQQFLIAWIGSQIIVSWTWLGNRMKWSVWINFHFYWLDRFSSIRIIVRFNREYWMGWFVKIKVSFDQFWIFIF